MILKRILNLFFVLTTSIIFSQNKVCKSSKMNIFLEPNTIGKCLINEENIRTVKNAVLISKRNRMVRNKNKGYVRNVKEKQVDNVLNKGKLNSSYKYEPYSNVQHITLQLLDESNTIENYINKSIVHSFDDIKTNMKGEIFVRLIIDKQGYIKNITSSGFEKSELLQKEIRRVIKSLSKITPIKLNNKLVNAEYYLSLAFVL